MRQSVLVVAALVPWVVVSSAARADQGEVLAVQPGVSSGDSARSRASSWLVAPAGTLEVGGELSFMTADVGLGADGLDFTDVGLLRTHVRYSIGWRIEALAAVELLAKQPSTTDEPIFQAGALAVRAALWPKMALYTTFAGGPLLDDAGLWGAAELGWQAKTMPDSTLVFEGTVGGAMTGLADDAEERPWFAEVVVRGDTILRTPQGWFAMWVGAEMRFPVAHDDVIDPQTRLNFSIGTVYAFVPRWDLFVEYTVVDRGDAEDPATTLPILDGGFDQQQLVFGVVRHFRADAPRLVGMLL